MDNIEIIIDNKEKYIDNDNDNKEKYIDSDNKEKNIDLNDSEIDYLIDKYNYYFDSEISFYKKYNLNVYNKLVNLKDNFKELNNIFKDTLFLDVEKYLIPYLKKINLINIESPPVIHKLERLLKEMDIPNIKLPNIDNILENIHIAFNIEKYYRDCKIFFDDCADYPISFQEPLFDPCKYPNILVIFNHFYEYCTDQRQMHSKSGNYFYYLNKCFLIPSLVLGTTGSIFSFLASTCFFNNYTKDIMSICVGVLTCIVVLLQSFMSAYQFDHKSACHLKSADLYDQILTSIDFEKTYPSNNSFVKDLEKEIIKIKSNNPYLVPRFIIKKFYKKKEERRYNTFIKNSIIIPGRKELINSIQTNSNNNMIINDNLDYLETKLLNINKTENNLIINKKLS